MKVTLAAQNLSKATEADWKKATSELTARLKPDGCALDLSSLINESLIVAHLLTLDGKVTCDNLYASCVAYRDKLRWITPPPSQIRDLTGQGPDAMKDREEVSRKQQQEANDQRAAAEYAAQMQADEKIIELLGTVQVNSTGLPVRMNHAGTLAKRKELIQACSVIENGKRDSVKSLAKLQSILKADRAKADGSNSEDAFRRPVRRDSLGEY
jgi:hypothetical protein